MADCCGDDRYEANRKDVEHIIAKLNPQYSWQSMAIIRVGERNNTDPVLLLHTLNALAPHTQRHIAQKCECVHTHTRIKRPVYKCAVAVRPALEAQQVQQTRVCMRFKTLVRARAWIKTDYDYATIRAY